MQKRFTLRRVALWLAVAAVFVPAAQAKPTPSYQLPRPVAEVVSLYDGRSAGPIAADDLSMSRPSNQGSPSVSSGDDGFALSTAVGGFGVALVLLIGGSALAIRHSRKTRLSPA
jgi:hypothetical protein